MKTNKTIVEQYKKYLKTIKEENTNVVESFGKLMDFVDQHCENKRLSMAIELDAIHNTLVQVRKRGIKLKEGGEWSSMAVRRAYELIKNLNRDFKDGSADSYKVNFHNFLELATKQPSNLRLYIHLIHEDSSDGKDLYISEKKLIDQLFEKETEEELEKVLAA